MHTNKYKSLPVTLLPVRTAAGTIAAVFTGTLEKSGVGIYKIADGTRAILLGRAFHRLPEKAKDVAKLDDALSVLRITYKNKEKGTERTVEYPRWFNARRAARRYLGISPRQERKLRRRERAMFQRMLAGATA